jgi:hypothetical protein
MSQRLLKIRKMRNQCILELIEDVGTMSQLCRNYVGTERLAQHALSLRFAWPVQGPGTTQAAADQKQASFTKLIEHIACAAC